MVSPVKALRNSRQCVAEKSNLQQSTEMNVLMMFKALEWKYLARNPFKGIKPLEVPARGERTLELDEEPRLLAACDRVRSRLLRPAMRLALNAGMRRASFCHGNGRSWT
jgi:integrase